MCYEALEGDRRQEARRSDSVDRSHFLTGGDPSCGEALQKTGDSMGKMEEKQLNKSGLYEYRESHIRRTKNKYRMRKVE